MKIVRVGVWPRSLLSGNTFIDPIPYGFSEGGNS